MPLLARLLLDCKLQEKHHTCSFVPPPLFILIETVEVYHCPYPFSFADIFNHTLRKCTPKQTQADTYLVV